MEANKTKRIFYLDFIRAIATLSIILTHYNALYIYMSSPRLENTILTVYPFGIYIGNLGVALFFIISGAALMHTYGDSFDMSLFYKKRIKSIYPMWWIAYVLASSYWFLTYKTVNPWGAERWKLLLSIIGFDQYFAHLTTTFGIIGEWFLGCIILMYLVFPVIRWLVIHRPKVLVLLSFAAYFVFIFYNPWPLWPSVNIFVRLPELIFWMVFYRYWNKVNIKTFWAAVIVLISTTIWNPNWDGNIKTTYIGIAFFLVLAYLARWTERSVGIRYVCSKVCKYSYAIFISHHIVIYELGKRFDLNTISFGGSVMLFIVCCEVIVLVAMGLYNFHRFIMLEISYIFQNKNLS